MKNLLKCLKTWHRTIMKAKLCSTLYVISTNNSSKLYIMLKKPQRSIEPFHMNTTAWIQLKKTKPGVSEKNAKLNNLVLSTREYLPYFLKRKSVLRTLVSFFKISGNINWNIIQRFSSFKVKCNGFLPAHQNLSRLCVQKEPANW